MSGPDIEDYAKLSPENQKVIDKRIAASVKEFEEDSRAINQDELTRADFTGSLRPQPKLLDATLLPYQREGHSWMVDQEIGEHEPPRRGGILADEMGMGKTIQTICCIIDNLPKNQRKNPPQLCPEVGTGEVSEGVYI